MKNALLVLGTKSWTYLSRKSLCLKGFKIVGSNPALADRMDRRTGYTDTQDLTKAESASASTGTAGRG